MMRSDVGRLIVVAVASLAVSGGAASVAAERPVRELGAGVTAELVSVSSTGEIGDDRSRVSSVTDDGRIVGFASFASNLVVPSSPTALRDRLTGVNESAAPPLSSPPVLSGDGSVLAFRSAEEIIPGVGNGLFQAYVRDRSTGEVMVASVSEDGELADQGILGEPQVSDDGRYVGFGALSSNLVEGDTNDAADFFVFDVDERRIERVSVAFDGSEADRGSGGLLSGDGRRLIMESRSTNLVPPDDRPGLVFVRDLVTGAVWRTPYIDPVPAVTSVLVHVSDDGRWATRLLAVRDPVTRRLFRQIWLVEVDTGFATLVSRTADGEPALLNAGLSALSGDGRYVVFLTSPAQAPGPLGGVYRYDRVSDTFAFVAEIGPDDLAISDDGSVLAAGGYESFDERDVNGFQDVYVFTIEQREDCPADAVTISGSGVILGTSGDDVILGSPGADVIDGFGGNDVICGGGGDDLLRGGSGDDVLNGGDGDDDLVGGADSDHLLWGPGDDVFRGGPGQDVADFRDAPSRVRVRVGRGRGDGVVGENDDVQNSVEVVLGSGFDDLIVGSVEANIIDGGVGDDRLRGGPGADLIRGEQGHDRIQGGAGDDTLAGNEGADVIRGDEGADLVLGSTGNDRLIGGPGPDTLDAGPGIDYCRGSAGLDTFTRCETADP